MWTEEEKQILQSEYPSKTSKEVALLIPRHSRSAILNKAFKLNVKRLYFELVDGKPFKICKKCLQKKPLESFESCGDKFKLYHRNICFECRREQRNALVKDWGLRHRDLRLETYRKTNKKQWLKNRGILEKDIYPKINEEFINAFPIYRYHPDFYHQGVFIEVKRASTCKSKRGHFYYESKYFPDLYFRNCGNGIEELDEKIEIYPKPLLVIVFNKDTGEELVRRRFE